MLQAVATGPSLRASPCRRAGDGGGVHRGGALTQSRMARWPPDSPAPPRSSAGTEKAETGVSGRWVPGELRVVSRADRRGECRAAGAWTVKAARAGPSPPRHASTAKLPSRLEDDLEAAAGSPRAGPKDLKGTER
ncbi:hypothetical protein P7K49_038830 [Saguinus oedipus]|uniref:Uncharacterized protein n=1 Tax=Saguinus oedipus TaxID=9490 RepID=A0ABQ9TFT9_SAGOE|nr:hypothetical protein P7K49_038830 [Saguinus oedipus]